MYDDVKYLVVVLCAVALSVVGLLFFRSRLGNGMSIAQRTLFATNFGYFTTLYTFFLGFAVVSLWQDYNRADAAITNESDLLVVEYRLSLSLSGTEQLRRALLEYVTYVHEAGWKNMREGCDTDGADALYGRIWDRMRDAEPTGGHPHSIYSIMLNRLIDLDKLRHQRLLFVNGNLYAPIWGIIYMGVVFTVAGFYFIDTDHRGSDVFFMFMMLAMVLGNIFLLYELDTPYSGVIRIEAGKFAGAVAAMRAMGGL
ncbi:hypothetical protein [Solidesulfovibrio sp.]|uniref:bestrophin-like domain n=1 Tax=Solidesulfovibrio sp. TaxID=2910990 RepID=UPI002B1F7359|nr:hypothetical protein [Solidesulfovibrio sp.]MEA5090306.1 hypothetical protein [Solidesulfovibrio sp.]